MKAPSGRAADAAQSLADKIKTCRPQGPSSSLTLIDADPAMWGEAIRMIVALLTEDNRVGAGFWLDAPSHRDGNDHIPADSDRCQLLDHDGSWRCMLDRIREVARYAAAEAEANRAPVVLVINSVTALSDITRAGATVQALCSETAQGRLDVDPYADVHPERGHWTQPNNRWRLLMRTLKEFRGIVVATSRAATVPAEEGATEIEALLQRRDLPRELLGQVDAYLVLRALAPPRLVAAPQLHGPLPRAVPDLTVAALIFDQLQFDPATLSTPYTMPVPIEMLANELFATASTPDLERLYAEHQQRPGGNDPLLDAAYEAQRHYLIHVVDSPAFLSNATTLSDLRLKRDKLADRKVDLDHPAVQRAGRKQRNMLLDAMLRTLRAAATVDDLNRVFESCRADVGRAEEAALNAAYDDTMSRLVREASDESASTELSQTPVADQNGTAANELITTSGV